MNLDPLLTLLSTPDGHALDAAAITPEAARHVQKLLALGHVMAERKLASHEVSVGMLCAHVALQQGASACRALQLGTQLAMLLRALLPHAVQPAGNPGEVSRVH